VGRFVFLFDRFASLFGRFNSLFDRLGNLLPDPTRHQWVSGSNLALEQAEIVLLPVISRAGGSFVRQLRAQ
jgi:hypothetical protein